MLEDISTTQLVGRWHCKAGRYMCDWSLRGDGSFSADVTERGITVSHQTGRWKIEGGELVTFSITDEFDMIGSSQDSDTLLEVAEEFFILKTRQGIRRRYERVQEKRLA
jgi:hypothetical protein